MRLAVALLVVVAARDVATGKCAMPSVGSDVITPAGTAVAADGGVLVGVGTSFGDVPLPGADTGLNPTWRFSDGTKEHEPVLTTLAPGLVVYRPPAGVTGALKLVDGKKQLVAVTFSADTPAPLAAPTPQAIKQITQRERYGGTSLKLRASFKAKPPAGARALVVLAVTSKGVVARSWTPLDPEQTMHRVAGTSGRCDPGIPGEIMSKPGDKVALAWVDEHGRLSKLSKPLVVTKGK